MPKLNGIELRNSIFSDERIKKECIPYVFFTTSANRKNIVDAYEQSVYGFFVKPASIPDFEKVIRNIVEYWKSNVSLEEASGGA